MPSAPIHPRGRTKIEFKNIKDGRLIRRTRAGTFLMGASQAGKSGKDAMVGFSADGKELWRAQVDNWPAHMGLRLANGDTVVASGHGASLMIFDNKAVLKKTIGGPQGPDAAAIRPNYSAQFQILANGNLILLNWQGHENNHGADGRQMVEYNAAGQAVWYWKQDPARISAIHGVIVLDNLDLNQAYDDLGGSLAPVQ